MRSEGRMLWVVIAIVLVLTFLWVQSWSWHEARCSARHPCTPAYMERQGTR